MKKSLLIAAAVAFLFSAGSAMAGIEGKCKACHNLDSDANKVGPGLKGIVGKKAGTAAGFAYSDAFKAAMGGKTWDKESLKAWVADSQAVAKGSKMPKQNVTGAKFDELYTALGGK